MVFVSDPRYLIIIIIMIIVMIRSTSTSQSPVVVEGNPIHRGAPEPRATADGADVVSVRPDGAIKAPAQSALDRASRVKGQSGRAVVLVVAPSASRTSMPQARGRRRGHASICEGET